MKAAFITGINGQDGSYLSELLLDKGYTVYGMIRRISTNNTHKIDHLYKNENFRIFYGDVTDVMSMKNIADEIKEDEIEVYHLAAQSHVKISFEMPEYTTEVDALGTLKLIEVFRKLNKKVKIYIACTSELYGDVFEIPQNEETPFNPVSPYAAAKQFAYTISKIYRESYGMFVCCGILFNHESPRRGSNFVTRKITIGLGKIIRGEIECIELGNLDAVRDWGHAKDYVEAMYLMMQQEKPDDFVIATGQTHTVREFIEKAFEMKGMKITWTGDIGTDQFGKIRITSNEKYKRPLEVKYLQGDSSKARRVLGWKEKYTFEKLIEEMVSVDT